MTMPVLGLDTSNYTTSAAVFDGADGCNAGRLLAVRPGELGLRQSDALFQHVKQLPGAAGGAGGPRTAPGPAGSGGQHPAPGGGGLLHALLPGGGVPGAGRWPPPLGCRFLPAPTSRGTWRRRPGPPGGLDLLDGPFLAWHLSGGTTELLLVRPEGTNVGGGDAGRDQRHLRRPAHRPHRRAAGAVRSQLAKALDELYPSGGCRYGVSA